jgi:hypothetical protein
MCGPPDQDQLGLAVSRLEKGEKDSRIRRAIDRRVRGLERCSELFADGVEPQRA